jgi:hypothetical protein
MAGHQRNERLRMVVVLVGLLEGLAQVVAAEQPGRVKQLDGLDDLVLVSLVQVETPRAVSVSAEALPEEIGFEPRELALGEQASFQQIGRLVQLVHHVARGRRGWLAQSDRAAS